MSALGHYLEERGLPTVSISLIRLHTEQIAPPRALWVPFELGRPFGAPAQPQFQRRVLGAALALFAAPAGPVLVDFEEEAPDAEDVEGWACPIALPAPQAATTLEQRLHNEVESLTSWYDLAKSRRQRTTFGVAGRDIYSLVDYLSAFLQGKTADAPDDGIAAADFLKRLTEDIKAYYIEAIGAQPGMASSRQMQNWFWDETEVAKCFVALHKQCCAAGDPKLRQFAERLLIPHSQQV